MERRNINVPADSRIVFRVGVNLGDVIVEKDGLYGGGVKIAARLESICKPGGVLISGKVYDECIAPGSLDTSLSHAAGLSDIAVCHA